MEKVHMRKHPDDANKMHDYLKQVNLYETIKQIRQSNFLE